MQEMTMTKMKRLSGERKIHTQRNTAEHSPTAHTVLLSPTREPPESSIPIGNASVTLRRAPLPLLAPFLRAFSLPCAAAEGVELGGCLSCGDHQCAGFSA
uniref:Uncharacterized protein n=1 Tax=Arundo donax TaxID=35708 RepID=A0A0A9BMP9_ARUDO